MVTEEQQWYVQKGARVQGPFTTSQVGRYLLLGRVRNTDRVSKDGELWEPVTQVPELIPEELLDLDSEGGWRRFLDARESVDERCSSVIVSAEEAAEAEQIGTLDGAGRVAWHQPERRDNAGFDGSEPHDEHWKQEWLNNWASSQAPKFRARPISILPISLLGITLAGLMLLIYLNATTGL